jgi:hypothetical protein
MVDTGKIVREWMLATSAITSLLGTDVNSNVCIYVGDDLPEGFNPKNGPGILISRRGGKPHPEIVSLVDNRVQIKVAADVENYLEAWTVYGVIHDTIHGATMQTFGSDGTVVRSTETTSGQEMTDPDTGWCYVISFYQIQAHA